jgi:hypothetical protein
MCLVLALGVIALAEQTLNGVITKVEGDKVTFKTGMFNKETKKFEYGDPVTLTVTDKVTVAKGTFNKETKMFEAGDAIADGLKATQFKDIGDKGVRATIITDGDKDKKDPTGKITKILTIEKKGK